MVATGKRPTQRDVIANLIAGTVALSVGHGIAQAQTFPAHLVTFVIGG